MGTNTCRLLSAAALTLVLLASPVPPVNAQRWRAWFFLPVKPAVSADATRMSNLYPWIPPASASIAQPVPPAKPSQSKIQGPNLIQKKTVARRPVRKIVRQFTPPILLPACPPSGG